MVNVKNIYDEIHPGLKCPACKSINKWMRIKGTDYLSCECGYELYNLLVTK